MVKVDFGISKFAIVGMAGYIAPRHLDAIKNSECDLVAAHDVADSVGIMDRYFPHADFTTDADKFAGILKHVLRTIFIADIPFSDCGTE